MEYSPFIEKIYQMTPEGRLDFLREEVEGIIQGAAPHRQLKLRALQAKLDGLRRKYKDPLTCAAQINQVMMESLAELNQALRPFRDT